MLNFMNMISSRIKPMIIALLALFFVQKMEAQGWRQTYDADSLIIQEWMRMVFQMNDGGYLLIGDRIIRTDAVGDTLWTKPYPSFSLNYYYGNNMAALLPDETFVVAGRSAENEITLGKFNIQGDLIWSKSYDVNNQVDVSGIALTPDGGFVILYSLYNIGPKIGLLKTNSSGDEQWSKTITGAAVELGRSIISLSDSGFAIAGQRIFDQKWKPYVLKTDDDGEVVWDTMYNMPNDGYAGSIIETTDHHIMVLGDNAPLPNGYDQVVFVKKLDLTGNELWSVLNGQYDLNDPGGIVETKDGYFVVCGELMEDLNVGNRQGFLWKINDDGDDVWFRIFDQDFNKYEFFKSVVQTSDGGYAIGGIQLNQPYADLLLLKTDALGYDYSHHLTGHVFRDDDLGCDLDSVEAGLDNWLVTAAGIGETYYGITDTDGNYDILVDTGTYEISLAPYLYWENCQPSYTANAWNIYDTTTVDIPLQPSVLCPYMEVNIASPFHELCTEGSYEVSYCNYGTVDAVGATVQVTLDDSLTYVAANATLISQIGQVLLFDIGTVAEGECGSFTIDYMVSCDLALFGHTLSSEAHIYPDSICVENFWLGPNIRVDARCENGNVYFNIINEGGDMAEPEKYIVIEDNLIMMTSDFQLLSGGETEVPVVAAAEKTYHLVAMQVPGFPDVLGYPIASATIEACVGDVNPGAYIQFSEDDGEPWLDIASQPIDGGYPANHLSAQPTGWQEEHFIQAETDIEYLIDFKNIGSDTALDVVIIDTLSSFLDPATLKLGPSSHPYSFEMTGQGVAKFKFENIPLSDPNSDNSNGWLQFKIAQKPDNPTGTIIQNKANIYLGFNAPIPTNVTFHTVGTPWAEVVNGTEEDYLPGLEILVFPNPMADWAVFEMKNLPKGENTLLFFDVFGQEVLRQPFTQNKALIQRGALAAGMYFFKLENGGKPLATGKIIIR